MRIETKRKVFITIWTVIGIGCIYWGLVGLFSASDSTNIQPAYLWLVQLLGLLEVIYGLGCLGFIIFALLKKETAIQICRRLCEIGVIYTVIGLSLESWYLKNVYSHATNSSVTESVVTAVIVGSIAMFILIRMRSEALELITNETHNKSLKHGTPPVGGAP